MDNERLTNPAENAENKENNFYNALRSLAQSFLGLGRKGRENKPRQRELLTRHQFLEGVFFTVVSSALAACGGSPTPNPQGQENIAPTSEPTLSHKPTSPSSPTPTNPEPTKAPTPIPRLLREAPTITQANIREIGGGGSLNLITINGEEMARRVGSMGKGWQILTNQEGKIQFFTNPKEGSIQEVILAQGPKDLQWDGKLGVFLKKESDKTIVFVPEVLLPGGYDEESKKAGPSLFADSVFVFQDERGDYRVAVVYDNNTVRETKILEGKKLEKEYNRAQKAFEIFGDKVKEMADGSMVYLSDSKILRLESGQTITRDETTSDLIITLKDGSYYRWVTRWENIKSKNQEYQAGGLSGPINMSSYPVDPSIPPIPYASESAPASIVPTNWQSEGYRYIFSDPKNLKAQVLNKENKPIAQASYDPEKKQWVWEKVEEKLKLVSAELTMDEAKRFIADAEDNLDEVKARHFKLQTENGETMKIFFSKEAFTQFSKDDKAKDYWLKLLNSGLNSNIGTKTKPTKPSEKLVPPSFVDNPSLPVIFLWHKDKPAVLFLADDRLQVNDKILGYLGVVDEKGEASFQKIPLYGYNPKETGHNWLTVEKYDIRYLARNDSIVVDDGWQIAAYLKSNDQGQSDWEPVPPHERKNGEFELLTPEQRMRKAMADLKEITGYDGSGLWERGKNTVVDYVDTQGQRRHQEVEIYFVHSSQDPKSSIIYEVIKDPATGEMMFTIRKAKEGNKENIQGLNEQQAALVRQAWAYLLAADPAVMQKFWRVNRTMGISIGIFPQLSSNNIQYGLILFNEYRIDDWGDTLSLLVETITVEPYELYGAQFGWGYPLPGKEGYPYINLPPDCLNTDAIADAAQRAVKWYQRYGNGLPPRIKNLAEGVTRSWADGTKNWGKPCQPQIPFEP